MDKELYLVKNSGCDDSTYGCFEFTKEEVNFIKSFVANLNDASTCGCMPTISLYKVNREDIRPATEEEEDDYEFKIFYFKGKPYTFTEGFKLWWLKEEEL